MKRVHSEQKESIQKTMSRLAIKPGSSKLEPSSKPHHILRVHPLLQRLQPRHIPSIYILQRCIIYRKCRRLFPNILPLPQCNLADLLRALLDCTMKLNVMRRIFPDKPDQERREAICTVGWVRAGARVVRQVGREEKGDGVGEVARGQFRTQRGCPELFGKFSHINITLPFEVSFFKKGNIPRFRSG